MKSATIAASFLILAGGLHGQLAPFNDFGVVMGHVHLNTGNVEAQKKLWIGILGARPVKLGTTEGVSVPGAVILFKAAAAGGPSEGSVVDHIGLFVTSTDSYPAKLDAAGWKYTLNEKTRQVMITGPDGLKLELSVDPAATIPVRFHHIHFYTADPVATQAWYAQKFGAKPGKRAIWDAGDLPGVNLTFAKATAPTAPTINRAIDHIGFEVRDLEAFCKKLEAAGVKFDMPFRKMPQIGLSLAFLTDPWGTRIELTEGLGKL